MELKTAIEILEYHQEWRLGKRDDMIYEPKKLTEALDIVLNEVKKLTIPAVINSVCPFCNSKETEENQPTRHCRYYNQDYGQTDL